jgi:hypothetical protein
MLLFQFMIQTFKENPMKQGSTHRLHFLLLSVILVASLGMTFLTARAESGTPPSHPIMRMPTDAGPATKWISPSALLPTPLISNLSAGTDMGIGIFSNLKMASSFITPATGSYTIGTARINLTEVSIKSDVFLWLATDNAGVPGTIVATFTPIHFLGSVFGFDNEINFFLPSPYTLAPSTTYWLIMGTNLNGGMFDAVYWGASYTTQPSGIFTYVKDMDYYSDGWNSPFWAGYRKWALYPPVPNTSVVPTSLDFGNQYIGSTSVAQTVTVTNTGSGYLHTGSLSFTSDWIISNDLCSNKIISPGNDCTFDVAFHPLAVGALSGFVTIPSDSSNAPDSVMVRGTGVTPPFSAFTSIGIYDGQIIEKTRTSETGGTANAFGGFLAVGDTVFNQQVLSILHFDTSSLPDDAVVVGAHLQIKQFQIVGTDPLTLFGTLDVDIASPFFGIESVLKPTDFAANSDDQNAGSFNPVSIGDHWLQADLDSSAFPFVNLTGPTQFRVRFNLPDNNNNKADQFRFYSGNAAAAYRPVLIVEYFIP